MEPQYYESRYNEVLGITNAFFTPVMAKYMKTENLDITKPRYGKQNFPVPWPFVISRLHCM